MSISRLQISNFRSFDELDVDLGNFNILIGANASGKSNFIEAIKFLRDITNHGIKNAISMQGGIEYVRNIGIHSTKDMSFKVVYDVGAKIRVNSEDDTMLGVHVNDLVYEFAIGFGKAECVNGFGQLKVIIYALSL